MYSIKIYEDHLGFSVAIKNEIEKLTKDITDFKISSIKMVNKGFVKLMKIPFQSSVNNIYFIDVELNDEIDGLQLGKHIRDEDALGYIVYISSHIELTHSLFQQNIKAMNFIYKGDVQWKKQLREAVENILDESSRIREMIHTKDSDATSISYLEFELKSVSYRLPINDIIHIDSDPILRRMKIIIKAGNRQETYIYPESMKTLMSCLPDYFVQTHRTCIINTKLIRKISKREGQLFVVLENDIVCPVSKARLKDLGKL